MKLEIKISKCTTPQFWKLSNALKGGSFDHEIEYHEEGQECVILAETCFQGIIDAFIFAAGGGKFIALRTVDEAIERFKKEETQLMEQTLNFLGIISRHSGWENNSEIVGAVKLLHEGLPAKLRGSLLERLRVDLCDEIPF